MINDSQIVKDYRKSLGLTQVEFSKLLGINTSTLSMVECGKNKLSKDLKRTIKEKCNFDIELGIPIENNIQNAESIIPIPFYHVKVAANPSGEVLIDYPEQDCMYFDKRFLKNILGVNPCNCSVLETKGDSMDSGQNKADDIQDGDFLLIDNSVKNYVNNKTYIIELEDSQLVVKKIIQDFNGNVTLISNNKNYPPRVLTEADNAILIGKVVYNISKSGF